MQHYTTVGSSKSIVTFLLFFLRRDNMIYKIVDDHLCTVGFRFVQRNQLGLTVAFPNAVIQIKIDLTTWKLYIIE